MIKDKISSRRMLLKQGKEIANRVIKNYEIEGHITIKLIGVSDNITYRIDTDLGERYLLRLHQDKLLNKNQIISELTWLEYLQERDVVVPQGVKNIHNCYVTEFETELKDTKQPCSLMKWVEGRLRQEGIQHTHLFKVGSMMAKLHNSSSEFKPDHLFVRPTWGKESIKRDIEKLEKYCDDLMSKEDFAIFQKGVEKISVEIDEMEKTHHTFGIIHGDLHMGNVVFHKGLPRVIDFGRCGYGFYQYDIAQTLLGIAPSQRRSFIEGYESIRKLPGNHQDCLETFFIMACIENISFHSSNPQEKEDLIRKSPFIAKLIKLYLSGEGFLYGRSK
ncbi:phosphotransferase [Alkalicella caledoniensis]|uniref:Phosphotransferase n=1 Tax=Alkalicella caledoniensis TaxID=2731377 RepID=A0A7G9W677_ALKCA|nr:phosphotransferase [Alkalicella caledoniensis]QNO14189.1 phosphotransferase [Alkalicella caledoniensis]